MAYLSRGKRSIMEQEYGVDARLWAKHFSIPMPVIRVRLKRRGNYQRATRTISLAAECGRDSFVHEFAHYLNHILYGGYGHGPSFRVSLVQVATVAYGRAERYGWTREYQTIQSWAVKNGLLKKEN